MVKILVAGQAVTDFVFQLEALPAAALKYQAKSVEIVGGGIAANAAVAIARLGGSAVFVTRVGSDQIGQNILSDLRHEGVNCDFALIEPDSVSPYSSVYVDKNGERQIVNFRGQGLSVNPGSMVPAGRGCSCVLVDTRWPEVAGQALKFARSRGVPGILDAEDPVPGELVGLASHVAFSVPGLRAFTGIQDKQGGLRSLAGRHKGWVCVTDGAAGTHFLNAGKMIHVPAFDVVVADTLGAGDVWHGAFALRLAEGAFEEHAVRFANAVAALKCTNFGGRRGCPDRAQADNLLREQI